MVPERWNVLEELEPEETSPAQPLRSPSNGRKARRKAGFLQIRRDFGSVQHCAPLMGKGKCID
jgi:hypothetical protein